MKQAIELREIKKLDNNYQPTVSVYQIVWNHGTWKSILSETMDKELALAAVAEGNRRLAIR